ncbi:hypothetical protein [Tessaracoccus coleopterorum]|uniref:hypothetical protein n=1 Tax=Tessaracoccus coleopterorum TaxID=2714950 RepID=UPI001E49675A|nr:hypothetical protein [Tessaracoccus coleopterorum]
MDQLEHLPFKDTDVDAPDAVQLLITRGENVPSAVGRKGRCPSRTGFEAASTKNPISSPPRASRLTGIHWARGLSDRTGVPSARWTRPSHWKPGIPVSKPRSATISTRRPAKASGTRPEIRNQVVSQARPQRAPTDTGE